MADVWNVTTKVMDTEVTKCTCGFKGYNGHKGADLVPKSTAETPDILSYDDGVVIYVGNVQGTNKSTGTAGMGTCVAIKHRDGTVTRYQHMKYNSLKVRKGDSVRKGQILGKYGRPETTGNSSGCHLHFDISLPNKPTCDYIKGTFNGETRYYVDPKPYLTKKTASKPTASDNAGKYKVTAQSLRIRKGPGTNYTSIGTLRAGMTVTVYSVKNGFGSIKSDSSQWCSMDYLEKI